MRRISRSSVEAAPLGERPERRILPDGGDRDMVEASLDGALENPLEQRVRDVRIGRRDRGLLGRVERGVADEPVAGLGDPAALEAGQLPALADVVGLYLGDPEHRAAARVQQLDHRVEVFPRRVPNLGHAATVPSCSRPHRLVA